MKNFLLPFLSLLLVAVTGLSAQAQVPAAEAQALTKQLNELMRNPHKPKQDVTLTLKDCHAEHIIRDRGADVKTSSPLALSFSSGESGWAMRMDNGVFEMKMSFEWANVSPLTYGPTTDDDGQKHFEIKLNSRKKGSGSSTNTSFELPLYTTDEATVKQITARLEKVRQSCK